MKLLLETKFDQRKNEQNHGIRERPHNKIRIQTIL